MKLYIVKSEGYIGTFSSKEKAEKRANQLTQVNHVPAEIYETELDIEENMAFAPVYSHCICASGEIADTVAPTLIGRTWGLRGAYSVGSGRKTRVYGFSVVSQEHAEAETLAHIQQRGYTSFCLCRVRAVKAKNK